MSGFLAICWTVVFVSKLFLMKNGNDPKWIDVLIPTFCLAFVNFCDWISHK